MWLAILALLIFGCEKGLTRGDTTPPAPPVLLPHPPDSLASEHGIDAVPENDYIRLEWLPNEEEDLAGYEIYRATWPDTTDFKLIRILGKEQVQTIIDGDTTYNYWDDTAVADSSELFFTKFRYAMKAYDEADNKSNLSEAVDYGLLEKIILYQPHDTVNTPVPTFKWDDPNLSSTGYILKVYDLNLAEMIWISGTIIAHKDSIQYNADQKATQDSLIADHQYKWRIDAIGPDYTFGSESKWMGFTYTP